MIDHSEKMFLFQVSSKDFPNTVPPHKHVKRYESRSVSAPAIRSLEKILDEIPSPREFIYRVGGHFGLSPEINMVVFHGQIEVEVIS